MDTGIRMLAKKIGQSENQDTEIVMEPLMDANKHEYGIGMKPPMNANKR